MTETLDGLVVRTGFSPDARRSFVCGMLDHDIDNPAQAAPTA
jgi:hypothetical protein